MLKFIVLAGASLAFVTVAAAADLPRPQPVYSQAPVGIGKQPIGKTPVGKTPIGKTPVGKNPTLVTKG